MQTLFLAVLALATVFAPAVSADQFETAASGAYNDSGLSSRFKEAGAGISAHSFEMGQTLQDRGGCCRDRGDHGGDHGRGGDRDYGRRRESPVDRTEREDRQREERERRDNERRDREWERDHPKNPPYQGPRGGDGTNGYGPGGGNSNGGSVPGRPVPSTPSTPSRGGQWSRWNGHPGWGHGHQWVWREARPVWWGWAPFVVIVGSTHWSCVNHFEAEEYRCEDDCTVDSKACSQACAERAPGDPACVSQCDGSLNYCVEECRIDRDAWVGRCPL